MYCNHCKKEQETITIAGKTYCANCSTVLSKKEIKTEDLPKHKIPKIEASNNKIRTMQVETPPQKEDPNIKDLLKETKIPEVNKDDLEGSAILLDILSDNAKDSIDKKTIDKNRDLKEASDEVLDLLGKKETVPVEKSKIERGDTRVMNDITIGKRKDYSNKKYAETLRAAEEEIKDEAEKLGRIITNESGYTKEYDIMIMSVALTAIVLVILAIFITFR